MITYNILVMAKDTGHYIKAGQKNFAEPPVPGAVIDADADGRAVRGTIDQIHVPPGCDEHCIGTIFLRES